MLLDLPVILHAISFRSPSHRLDSPVVIVPRLNRRFRELSLSADLGNLSLTCEPVSLIQLLEAEKPEFHYKIELEGVLIEFNAVILAHLLDFSLILAGVCEVDDGLTSVHESWQGAFDLIDVLVPEEFEAMSAVFSARARHYRLHIDSITESVDCSLIPDGSTFEISTSCHTDELAEMDATVRENISSLSLECDQPSIDLRALPKVRHLSVLAQQPFAIIECTPVVPLEKLTVQGINYAPLQPVHAKIVTISLQPPEAASEEPFKLDCAAFQGTQVLRCSVCDSSRPVHVDLDQLPSLHNLTIEADSPVHLHASQPRHIHSLQISCPEFHHSPQITVENLTCLHLATMQSLSSRLRIVNVDDDFSIHDLSQLSSLPASVIVRLPHLIVHKIWDAAVVETLIAQSRFELKHSSSRGGLLDSLIGALLRLRSVPLFDRWLAACGDPAESNWRQIAGSVIQRNAMDEARFLCTVSERLNNPNMDWHEHLALVVENTTPQNLCKKLGAARALMSVQPGLVNVPSSFEGHNGGTLLHLVVKSCCANAAQALDDCLTVLRVFRTAQADLTLQDGDGKTPIDLCDVDAIRQVLVQTP